jgi:hypothetical protein
MGLIYSRGVPKGHPYLIWFRREDYERIREIMETG